jgi:dTDP-4-dehydrorhamnose reductase
MKKVLLLGPNGQLGTDLQRLNAEGIRFIPVGRQILDLAAADRIVPVLEGYDFEALVNCASYNKVDQAESDPEEAYAINGAAVARIAEACRRKGARLIHISTDYVFDGKKTTSYREEDPPGPINVYGASKLAGEKGAGGAVILRTASLFGIAGSSGKGGNFVETIVKMCQENLPLRIVNDITMSPTATEDLARMIFALLKEPPPPGIYHAVNSGSATWYEFTRAIVEQAGLAKEVLPITSAEYPRKAKRPAMSVLDNRKLAGLIGEIPDWRQALDRYLRAKGYR